MSKPRRTVLVANDPSESNNNYEHQLQQDVTFAYQILTETDNARTFALCRSQQLDGILLEFNPPYSEKQEFLSQLKAEMGENCPPIIAIGSNDIKIAVWTLKNGAADYLIKDEITPNDLRLAMRKAIENAELRTSIKQDRAARQASQKRNLELAEAIPEIVWTGEATGLINYWNQRWYEYTGLSEAESMGLAGASIIHPDERDRTLEKWHQAIATGEKFEIEYRLRRWDGIYHWFICRGLPTRDSQGEITGWIGTITDIDQIEQSEIQIRRREEQIRRVLDSLFIFVGVMTPSGVLIEANQPALTAASLQPADVVGKPFEETYWWAYDRQIQSQLRDAIERAAKGEIIRYDVKVRLGENQFLIIDFALVPLFDQTGRVEYLIPSGIDISDRLQSEALLRESQAQLQQQLAEIEAIYQTAPIGLNVLDRDLRFVRINQHLAKINGLNVEAHLGRTVRELLPDIADTVEELLHFILETGEPLLNIEISGETPAQPGVKRTWLEQFIPLKNGDRVIGISTVCEEITERKQVEEALRQSEERFRNMADNAPMMIWVTDPTGYCIYLSKSWYEFTGQTETTGLGVGWLDALHPDDYNSSREIFFQANKDRQAFQIEYRLRHQNGEYRWAIDAASPWFSEDGKFKGYIGSVVDISDRKQMEAILRESEERFRTLADNISQFAWMADENGWIFWYNQRWFDYTGTTLEQMQGWGWQQVHHPDRVEQVVEKISYCFKTGEIWEDTFPLRGKDGQYRWFLSRALPIRDEAGNILRWFGTNTDITELRETEIALQQTTERLNIALKSAPITLFNQDLALRYTWIYNPTFSFLEQEIIGKQDADLVSPESAAYLTQLKQQVLDTGIGLRKEVKITQDGKTAYYDLTIDPIRDSQNALVGITCAAVDINDRKQAEEALRQSEDRLRMAVESAQLGTWDWNLTSNELVWDACCKAMFGLPPEAEINIEKFFQALHPDDRDRTEEVMQNSLKRASGGQYDIEYRTIGIQDGVERWIAARGQVYFHGNGKPIRFVGTVLNITEQKQAQALREQLFQREQAAREEAELANRLKDEFLAVLSHELRTPLNPILGWVKLLQTRKFDETKTAVALATIERNARLQTQLIDDLLDVARILRGKLAINFAPTDLVLAIENALETVRTTAEHKSISLISVLPHIGKVSGDPARLQQIVWNLLSNAVKFTPNGGQVEIILERVGDQAQITVKDTGKGIRREFLPQIFESFRQQDTSTTRQFGGLGLGLAIVRYLVKAHGGAIAADSPGEGLGSTFKVRLPLLNVESDNSQTNQLPKPKLDLTGIRVLAVDDESDARELLTALFAQYKAAEVKTVASAKEVLAILPSFQPDVLVSDLGMPDLDGYSLIQQIRALPPEKGGQIPAIALTAYAREEDRQRALKSGYQRHVTKPIEPEKLVQVAIELLRANQLI
ncbi:MAG: PAS domain S-box protein [Oscillatoria sp. PMC 1051.18]|nr:PAS domain S-box protein [Oscillatoria sp. PMC 1050.18]MEC5028522.1 PAS domain S-box protein [Oscillatoria sp. PMC 1051.18]